MTSMRNVRPAPVVFCDGVTDRSLSEGEAGTLLTLRVSPSAKKTGFVGLYGESALKLKVAAPPVDSKANVEVDR
ncbi:hypothetical protein BH23ACT11_BH23ACT11_03310 [soil metagenome]